MEKSPRRFPGHARLLGLIATGAMAFSSGCGPDIIPRFDNPPNPTTSSIVATETPNQAGANPRDENDKLQLPFEGTWYLNGGPHNFRLGNKVSIPKNLVTAGELDFAPRSVINCSPDDPKLVFDDAKVEASASGKVLFVGDEKNRQDPNHSMVEIDHGNGYETRYTHVANIKVHAGEDVLSGQLIGNPSCEFPPSGSTNGLHLDFSVLKDGQIIDARNISLSGWKFFGEANYQGGATFGNEIRQADAGRAGPSDNRGFRNDLDGFPTGIIKVPNVGNAGLKTPTPTPIEKPTPTKTPEKPQPNLVVNLKYADGKPIPNSEIDIFKQGRTENGKIKTDGNRIQAIETGTDGSARFNLPPGKYLALFGQTYANQTRIMGEGINDDLNSSGITDIDISSTGQTIKDFSLGRLLIHFSDGPKYQGHACIYLKDILVADKCLSTDGDTLPVDLVPSQNYETRIYTSQSILVTGEVKIGNTPLRSGQITELFCATTINPGCSIIPPKN